MATFFKDMFEPSAKKNKKRTDGAASSRSGGRQSAAGSRSQPQAATSAAASGSAAFFRDIFNMGDEKTMSPADIDRLLGLPFREQGRSGAAAPRGVSSDTLDADDAAATAAAIDRCKSLMRSFWANHPASRRRLQSMRQNAALSMRSASFDEARLLDEASDEDNENDAAAVVAKLEPGFFENEFDPLARALEGFQLNDAYGEAFIMERMSEHKRQEEAVHRELLSIVQENHASLVTGMRQVQQIDMELTRASINAKNARRRLRLARDNLVRGDLQVVGLYRRRARAKNLLAQLEVMGDLLARRASLFAAADRDDVPGAVDICVSTMRELDAMSPPLPAALQELRGNMAAALPSLRARVDDTLRAVCAAFGSDAYRRVVLAYVSLDAAMAEYLTEEHLARLRTTRGTLAMQTVGSRLDGVAGLAHRVQRIFVALVEQVLKNEMIAILRSALEVLGDGAPRDAEGAGTDNEEEADLAPPESSSGEQTQGQTVPSDDRPTPAGENGKPLVLSIARAQGLPLKEVCDQLPTRAKVRPSFVRRLGSALKDVSGLLRNYDAVDTWHAQYAQESAADVDKLISASTPEKRVKVASDLATAAESLSKNRRVVWGGVLSHIATVTKSPCARFPVLKLQGFERLIRLLELLALESEAFGGDTCLLEARAFIRETSKTYCKDFHADRVEALRSFLLREHWHLLGVSLASLGGVHGLVDRGASKALVRSPSLDEEDAVFDTLDDPARQTGASQPLGDKPNPFECLAVDDLHADAGGNPRTDATAAKGSGAGADAAVQGANNPANGVANARATDPSNGNGDDADAVLTSTIVNCLAKDLGSSLVMMERLSGVASDIFEGMCNLVWTYLYALLTNFVPASLLVQVFDRSQSHLASDYAVLRECMERARRRVGAPTRAIRAPAVATKFQFQASGTSTPSSPAGSSAGFAGAASSFKAKAMLRAAAGGNAGEAGSGRGSLRRTSAPSLPASSSASSSEAALGPPGKDIHVPARFSDLYHCEGAHDALDALSTRIVAAESSAFVFRIMHEMRPRIEAALPAVERVQVAGEAFAELEGVCGELRAIVHRGVARILVDRFAVDAAAPTRTAQAKAGPNVGANDAVARAAVSTMVLDAVDWAKIRSLQSEPSPYVDKLIMRMRKIWSHLQRECAEGATFPLSAIPLVWSRAIEEVMDQVLDAIATIEKCGTEGRALLSMDLATLARGLQDVTPGRADIVDPARQRVEDFIKAFYYDRFKDVVEWIKHNRRRYDRWHLENLVKFGVGAGKTSAQVAKLLSEAEPALSLGQ